MSGPKSFEISKHMVFEAYRRVKANKGAAGVDGQSVGQFEQDLKGNLYKLWNRMSSGSYFPPPVRMVEIPKPGGKGVRVSACLVSRTGSRRRWRPWPWSRRWRRSSIPIPTGTGPARARWMRSGHAASAAGGLTGLLILISKGSWMHDHTAPFADCGGQNSPSWGAGGSIRRPFLRPVRTWTARSRPSLTRCMMVWRETR